MKVEEVYDTLYKSYMEECAISDYPSFMEAYRQGRRKTFESVLRMLDEIMTSGRENDAYDIINADYMNELEHGCWQGDYLTGLNEVYKKALRMLKK